MLISESLAREDVSGATRETLCTAALEKTRPHRRVAVTLQPLGDL
jgi:hypothetical protein